MSKIEEEMFFKFLVMRNGSNAQLIVTIEELSELTKELTKVLRGNGKISHVVEELTDVEIMLDQVKLILNISDEEIEKARIEKLNRTKKRYNYSE